ncbi:3-demethylubiquinone-9 3-methyltransferase [Methanosarcina horonobensis HB-1 = JCM 15518]|uniref:3-demethylubiquinone-9 3-methyltransferase n=1 Tax=Methanosarcina horonobensis HB-1 = JCM 15518 TaxID=1434110 RepID=A0A0E3SC15_9EURY|nr:VOC family protein [Methanosarcina horonobensis]AKB77417.1 3-demethylubiquinone-9 3-methyltransferase [Methanosarcina horonobensis HB-1 = JCM 15518]
MKASTQKIAPCLTFNDQAEEAANFYVSIFSAVFENSKILNIARFSKEELEALSYLPEDIRPGPAGSVRTIRFLLNGQEIEAVNGGNFFNFCEGMSLYVRCEDQKEIDWLWEKLSEGGEKSQCGWLKDKYGVSWQIAPAIVDEMLSDPDPEKSNRVIIAIYGMKKYDIEALKRAYEGR